MVKKETQKEKVRNISLDLLDRTPISELLTFSAEELFSIQDRADNELNKASYRKKWIDGVIELKYKRTINEFKSKAIDYLMSEDNPEMDKYNRDILVYYIQDESNRDNLIQVEFYRGNSDISGKSKVMENIRLVKNLKIINRTEEIKEKEEKKEGGNKEEKESNREEIKTGGSHE